MSIDVIFSNRPERLLSELAGRAVRERRKRGPLEPTRVVVPHAFVGQAVARALSVMGAGFNVATVGQRMMFSELAASLPGGRPLLTAEDMRGPLLSLLSEQSWEQERELLPVRRFLGEGASRAAKAAELSSLLADTFEEYEWWRPLVLEGWKRGLLGLGADEAWQRALFLRLTAEQRLPSGLHVSELLALLRGASSVSMAPVHAFMLGPLPPVVLALLERLGQATDVYLYDFNPSEEFWDDPTSDVPPLLARLGGAVRTGVSARQKLVEWNTLSAFAEPAGSSLLAHLQRDVLHFGRERLDSPPVSSSAVLSPCRSARIFDCPSQRSELDVAAREVRAFAFEAGAVSLDEVAVLLTGEDWPSYIPHVRAAFFAAFDLPYCLATTNLSFASDAVVAFQKLLRLPLGRFDREELLSLVTSPPLSRRLGAASSGELSSWCDELAIFAGRDRVDLAGTYVAEDVHTWDPGLRRLALGAVMSPDEGARFSLGADEYAPLRLGSEEVVGAILFARLARSLIEDAHHARTNEKTLAEWMAFLRTMLFAYVDPSSPGELDHILVLDGLLSRLGSDTASKERVPYRSVVALVSEAVSKATTYGGGAGVLVGPLSLLEAIPLRMVVVVGLGAGRTPEPVSSARVAPFDLRRENPLPEDVSPASLERAALLQTILSARERVVLTYVGREATAGEPIAPSGALSDIVAAISALSGGGNVVTAEPDDVPDRPVPSPGLDPSERAEVHALVLAKQLHDNLVHDVGGEVSKQVLLADLRRSSRAPLRRFLRLSDPPAAPSASVSARATLVSLSVLRQFLEQPVLAYARVSLGIAAEEISEEEAAPLATSRRNEPELLRRAFALAVTDGLSFELAYRRSLEAARFRGEPVRGLFGEAERVRHLAMLSRFGDVVRPFLAAGTALLEARFGPGGGAFSDPTSVRLSPPTFMTLDGVTISVVGQTGLVCVSPPLSVVLAPNREIKTLAKADGMGQLLRPFLDHVALSASGCGETSPRRVVLASGGDTGAPVRTATLKPVEQSQAMAYLESLATELVTHPHAYYFPAEAAFVAHLSPEPMAFKVAASLVKPSVYETGRGLSPIAPESYPLPNDAEAAAMAERRFGLFWETVSAEES